MKDKADEARMTEAERKEKIQREKKKEFRKSMIEKEMEIARIVEEKQEEEGDLMEIIIVEGFISI